MKTFCTLSFLLLIAILQVNSQEMPEIEKRMYTSPEGKLYVQKSLPIFLYLGTKADDKSNISVLKSERTGAYSNPMYFDSEGLNTIRSPWCVDPKTKQMKYPQEDIVFEVYADSKAPVTSMKFVSSKPFASNGKTYINGKAEINLSATDQLSGLEKIMFSINQEPYKEYTTTLILEIEGEYKLSYFSYDRVGNVESAKSIFIVLDKTSPKTSLEIKGDYFESVLSGNAKLVLKTEENASGIARLAIKLNDESERNYQGAINTSKLPQGQHKLIYYAIDNLGNTEEPKELSFYVDKTAPTILPEIMGKTFMINGKEFSSGRSMLKLTTLDNKAGVKEVYYSINESEYKLYEKPVVLSATGGNVSIKAYALDMVNNKSQTSDETQASAIPYIDLSGPVLGSKFLGPVFETSDTIYISRNTKIRLSGADSEAGFKNIVYKIDGSSEIDYQNPFSIEQSGMHEISFTGFDNVDNSSNRSFKVFVDSNGPSIFPRFSTQSKGKSNDGEKENILYPAHVGLFIAATDIESGYDQLTYSVNGSKEKAFSGFINGFSKKSNLVKVTAYDKLGNTSEINIEFNIVN